jgi:hypothetical protein
MAPLPALRPGGAQRLCFGVFGSSKYAIFTTLILNFRKDRAMANLGEVYTEGNSFRARAEARQREYRAYTLGAEPGIYGHFLAGDAASEDKNFPVPEAFQAAKARQAKGKGKKRREQALAA